MILILSSVITFRINHIAIILMKILKANRKYSPFTINNTSTIQDRVETFEKNM